MPDDLSLVDECSTALVEFATTDPFMRGALGRAREAFFGGHEPAPDDASRDMANARLLDWFLFDHKLGNGKTPLQVYLRVHGHTLRGDQRAAMRDFRYSVYSVFEVVDVLPGHGMRLRDLADDTEYPVCERAASAELEPGAYVLGRVLPFGDKHLLSAALSIWSRAASPTICAAYERAKKNAGSIYVSPIDMEPLFREPAKLPEPAEAEREPAEAPAAAEPKLGMPTDEELRVYAALADSPWEALDSVRKHHAIQSPEELRRVMAAVHRVFERRPRSASRPAAHPRVHVPLAAGPRERVLMRMFAAVAEREITRESHPDPAAARAELHALQRRWLDTRQDRLDSLTPREIIQAERERTGWQGDPLP